LGEQGDAAALAELWARADAGDYRAAERLTDLLAQNGRLEELWQEVDAGTPDAGKRLITLLDRLFEAKQADRITSSRRPDFGIPIRRPDKHLIENLRDRIGGTEQTDRMRSFGLNPDGSIADGDPKNHRA
jgi:hypothetical protein